MIHTYKSISDISMFVFPHALLSTLILISQLFTVETLRVESVSLPYIEESPFQNMLVLQFFYLHDKICLMIPRF